MQLVFASGFFVPQRLIGFEYFRGMRAAFPDALFPVVSPLASIAQRASALADAIQEAFPAGAIHVIAHSMGGLDTRMLLARNTHGLAAPGRIAALSTISTPHRGSPIADLLVGPQPVGLDFRTLYYRLIETLAADIGLDIGALGELTSGFAATFNHDCPDVARVAYRSYAGGTQESIVLKPAHLYCEFVGTTDDERMNDGLVPLALISRFDHLAAIRQIVDRAAKAASAETTLVLDKGSSSNPSESSG
jgi:triacylglycerol lipase